MAMEVPDMRSLKKWEDAFQYPIPTTRAIEKKLRTSLNENHDKLRTLVGYAAALSKTEICVG